MTHFLFQGSATALATPFADGAVDFDALARLIDFQLEHRTDALVICGTTGEPATLTQIEKDSILSFALERVRGRVPVLAGTGGNCTRNVIESCLRAQSLGAQGLLLVTPYYNKTSQRGLIAHYQAVADAVELPLILYNVPSRTGVNLLPETAARLAEHPRIVGIKEASGNISQIAELARLIRGRMALYAGNDDQVLPILALGGIGVISAVGNVIPGQMRDLVNAWRLKDMESARSLQLSILPLCRALFSDVNPIPVKAALHMMGLCRDEVRLPLVELDEAKRDSLRTALRELELTVQ